MEICFEIGNKPAPIALLTELLKFRSLTGFDDALNFQRRKEGRSGLIWFFLLRLQLVAVKIHTHTYKQNSLLGKSRSARFWINFSPTIKRGKQAHSYWSDIEKWVCSKICLPRSTLINILKNILCGWEQNSIFRFFDFGLQQKCWFFVLPIFSNQLKIWIRILLPTPKSILYFW